MKSLKLLGTFILVAIMALTIALPTTAAPVIDPTATGSITIHKYAIEEGMSLILNADGTVLDPDTVITDEGDKLGDLHALENVEFTVIRVQDTATNPDTAQALTGEGAYSETRATDENGKVVFSNLAVGVYLVTEIANQAILEPVEHFLVSIPMTNPTGDSWIYDVHVYPKNKLAGAPEIDKYVTEIGNKYDGYQLGDEITWFIACEIPSELAGISDAKEYKIHDDLHEYLKYVEDSVRVYLIGDSGDVEFGLGTHYTFTPRGFGFDIVLTTEGLAFVDSTIDSTTSPDNLLYVEYKTILDIPQDKLEENLGEPISGNAYDTYINAAGIPYSASVETKPAVHTGGINLLKIDGNNSEHLLSGAKFKIYLSEADAQAGINAVLTPFGGEEWEVVTSDEGVASFYGLAYGAKGDEAAAGESIYWIVETQAPEGYNLLKGPVAVTVNAVSHLQANIIEVENFKGFTLPVTGGMGTVIFMALGSVLIISATLILIVSSKRKRAGI